MINRSDFPFHDLSIEERLLLVEDIWDSIASDQNAVPLTDAQREHLRRRLAEHTAHPQHARSWEQAKRHVQAALDDLRQE